MSSTGDSPVNASKLYKPGRCRKYSPGIENQEILVNPHFCVKPPSDGGMRIKLNSQHRNDPHPNIGRRESIMILVFLYKTY